MEPVSFFALIALGYFVYKILEDPKKSKNKNYKQIIWRR